MVAGEKGFGKINELSAVASGFVDEFTSFVHRRLQIKKDRSGLHGGDFDGGKDHTASYVWYVREFR